MKKNLISTILCFCTLNCFSAENLEDFPESKYDSMKNLHWASYRSGIEVEVAQYNQNKAYYDFIGKQYSRSEKFLDWQLYSSIIIFWVVIGLVICGVVFSAVQFIMGLRSSKIVALKARQAIDGNGKIEEKADDDNSKFTKIKFGTEGFEFSSSILGVIILAISIAFFYLYLSFVYPLNELSNSKVTNEKEATS